jgi:hypothetical protein
MEREIVMWKLRAVLLLGVLSWSGCLSEAMVDTPLSGKESSLEGQWRLELAEVEVEEFDFSYTFSRDGSFTNRVGGAFLARIEELNTIDGIDIDTGQLDALDGGFLVLHGTWSADGDSLDIDLERMQIDVFGTVPIVGRLSVPVHEEPLMGDNRIGYRCAVDGDRLSLNGDSLTLGIGLEETNGGFDPLAVEVLRLTSDFALQHLSAGDEDEFSLFKVK